MTDRRKAFGIYDRIHRSPELQAVPHDIDRDNRCYARGIIAMALRRGDVEMAKWFASRKMRNEGYDTRAELNPKTRMIVVFADYADFVFGQASVPWR